MFLGRAVRRLSRSERGAQAPCTWQRSRRLFVRGVGVCYAIAFLSLWVQVDGLIGSGGIVPAAAELAAWGEYCEQHDFSRWARFPTLFWFGASDSALHFACGVGVLCAVAMVAGLAPAWAAALAWVLYLSLTVAGGAFLSFQWDVLLLEAGLITVFVAPWQLRSSARLDRRAAPAARWLVAWLVFRLMFASGAVKLASGDMTWSDGTALTYHYETQPLPTPLAAWAHGLPFGFQQASCWVMFFIELVVPFGVFGPRWTRRVAVVLLVVFQVLIALTGNYGFFNLLTVVLCLGLWDDGCLPGKAAATPEPTGRVQRWACVLAALVVVPLGALHMVRLIGDWTGHAAARWGDPVLARAQPFRSVNSYGLFRVMTTERAEITIEGSADGVAWSAYRFRYKPNDPRSAPGWIAPHMPRLDWQMWFLPFPWFAGRDWRSHSPWFQHLLLRLLEGAPDVEALFAENPFEEVPPRFVRARISRFSFADPEDPLGNGEVWVEEFYPRSDFVPSISLNRR